MTDLAEFTFLRPLPRNVLETLFEAELRLRRAHATHLGHPYNLQPLPHVPASLATFLIRNEPEPLSGAAFAAQVRDLEDQVTQWLAKLWGAGGVGDVAGSVLPSGSLGNLAALHLGHDSLPGAVLLHGAAAHRSIAAAGRLLRIDTRAVACTATGGIDLADLELALARLAPRPVILALTCGTPLKGAHDDIAGAIGVLDRAGIGPDRRFVHLDGALGAMVLPFLPAAPPQIRPDFGLGLDSILTCGDKMIGAPMPCAALLCRRSRADGQPRPVASDGALPAAMGPGNGHAVLAMWLRLMTQGFAGFAADALRCSLRAGDLARALHAIGADVLVNPFSLTVVFPRPADDIVQTFQLPCQAGLSRAIIMPSVSDALIDRFTAAYSDWFRTAGKPD